MIAFFKNILSEIETILLKPADEFKIIGEALKEKGIITEGQLNAALELQRVQLLTNGKTKQLGMIVTDQGYASEEEVIQAINDYYKISVTSLTDNIKELVGKKRGSFIDRLPTPRIPIWLQIFATTSLVVIITILMLNSIILGRQKEQLYQQTVKIGMVSLNYFEGNSRIPLLQGDMLRLNTLIKDTPTEEALLYAFIVNQDRKIMAHTDLNMIQTEVNQYSNPGEVTKKGDISYFSYLNQDKEQILNLSKPVIFKGKKLGEVNVGISIDFINLLIKKERASIITVTLIILFFGIVIAVLLGFRFSRPISQLVKATQEVGHGNYQFKLETKRNDELGNLAKAFNQMSEDLWKKSLMQESFGKYVGSEVLELILANPENTWLKGHKNEATILFADIRGFTSYTDSRTPEKVVEGLNKYFDMATQAILNNGGYIDKFIGDAVLGVFGVPVYHKNHIERAVRAAVELNSELQNYKGIGHNLITSVGIGIASGVVIAGNIGSEVKMEYTVIGDCVNVASRLNELAGSGDVIITKLIYEKISDIISVKQLTPRKIKGKSKPLDVYKVLDIKKVSDAKKGK